MRAKTILHINNAISDLWVKLMSREKFWALKAVLSILSIYFGSWVLFGLVLDDSIGSGASVLMGDAIDGLVIFLLFRAAKRSYSMTPSEMAITFQLPWKNVLLGLLTGIAIWLGAGAISDMLRFVSADWATVPREYSFVAQFSGSRDVAKAVMFLVFGFTTPIIEEVLFRGIIYSILRRAFSLRDAILISSFFFGLVHVYPEAVIISFIIGCSLARLREQEKSLLGPITAHVIVNCLTLVFSGGNSDV